jgi:hypothetical protein
MIKGAVVWIVAVIGTPKKMRGRVNEDVAGFLKKPLLSNHLSAPSDARDAGRKNC